MSFLTGTAPSAKFSTQPTISPAQNDMLNMLRDLFSGQETRAANLGQGAFNALDLSSAAIPTGITPGQTDINKSAFNTLLGSLGFQAPNVTAPQATTPSPVTSTPVTAQQIDPTAAFKTGVVQPLTDDFLSRTLPAIAGQMGGTAGGAYGSGSGAARQTAATNLERTLSQTGSQYALGAQQANQAANLQAATTTAGQNLLAQEANQGVDLSTILANLQSQLTTGLANQGAATTSNQQRLAALGLAPSTSTLEGTQLGADIGLGTAAASPFLQFLAALAGGGTGATQQTIGVGSGGSTGLLGGLLGNSGIGTALGNFLFSSDRRLKEDIEKIGDVDGLPLYRFRYKGQPSKAIGFMADEVEKRNKSAVVEIAGYKAVNYNKVLTDMLEAA